jgi:type II secretory pathway component PulF
MALELQEVTKVVKSPSNGAREFTLTSLTRAKVGDNERMFFTEQLALLLETGANLYNALLALKGQSGNPAMEAMLEALTADIAEGRPFSDALAKHPEVFSANYVNLVAASEKGGFMHTVLYELKTMEEKRGELKRTVVSALSYPAFLLAFSGAVVVFVLLVVFPKFGDLFTSIYDQLPITTKVLMRVSDVMRSYGIYIVIGLGGAIAMFVRWIATPGGRAAIDKTMLSIPFVRDIFAELNLVQVLRVMSLSLGNGVAMIETLHACRDVVSNSLFKQFIGRVEGLVQEGGRVAQGFEQASFVPAIAKTMISTAEESGNLARVAGRLADYYEQELTQRLKTVSRMAEPIMLLVMGTVVGLLVSSLILPIFKLARAVS